MGSVRDPAGSGELAGSVLDALVTVVARERGEFVVVLAHIAEVDARRLYVPAGSPSMHAYCVDALHFSEDAAHKRIQAARAARELTGIFDVVAEGRLHLAGVCLLAPHLTRENADVLIAEAARKTKAEIEQLLAQRFPRTERMPLVQALPASGIREIAELAPGQVAAGGAGSVTTVFRELAPGQVGVTTPRTKIEPVAAERFSIQGMIGKDTHDKLRYAQELPSHRMPSGDLFEACVRAALQFLSPKPRVQGRIGACTAAPA